MENQTKSNILLPISILVAAVLIAGALIYNAGVRSIGGDSVAEEPSGDPESMREVTASDHVWGNVDAPVKLVVFEDTECPFCKRYHDTLAEVAKSYKDKVAIVWRHFPLDIHSKARKEAEATECAAELGGNDKFWAYVDKLFKVTPSNDGLDPNQLPIIAAEIGLDKTLFEACLSSGKYAPKIEEDYQNAIAAGGSGTPYSIVVGEDGKKYPFSGALPFDQVKLVLEEALR